MAAPTFLSKLANEPLLIVVSSLASTLSGILTVYISRRITLINRKLRFSSRQEPWLAELRTLTAFLSQLLGDQPGNRNEIRVHLAKAKPILESIAAHTSPMTRRRWVLRNDARRIGKLLRREGDIEGARGHYERLIETSWRLSETIELSKVFEAKV